MTADRLAQALRRLRLVVPYFWQDDNANINELDAACGEADDALAAHEAQSPAEGDELPLPQPHPEVLPHPGEPEVDKMLDTLLAEYGHPANAKNAARAGYMAARRLLQHARQQLPAVDDAEPVYIRTLCKALDAALDFAGTVAGGASWWDDVWAELDAEVERTRQAYYTQAPAPAPIDMVLHCPSCGLQHVDEPWTPGQPLTNDQITGGEPLWENPPHRSHLCHGCGHIWRPADVPTNGVQAVQTKGKADSPIRSPAVAPQKPLTDAQIEELKDDGVFYESCKGIVREIERLHGISVSKPPVQGSQS